MKGFFGAQEPQPFTPARFPEVKAWYRVENATMAGAEVATLADELGGASFTRNVSAPGPARATTANGLSVLVWTAAEALAAASATAAWRNATWHGMAFWFKSSQETSQGDFFSYYGGSTGLADNRINCRTVSSTRIGTIVRDAANTGNRLAESTAAGATQIIFKSGVWTFVAWEFDGGQPTEATRNRHIVNGTALAAPQADAYSDLTGTPGPNIVTLRTATASPDLVTLGCRDVDQATSAVTGGVRGQMGPDIIFYDPSAMGIGKLRMLMNYRVPRG